nr:GDSL esterase/lipase At1g09390-like isoform X4 [Coffea arabica]
MKIFSIFFSFLHFWALYQTQFLASARTRQSYSTLEIPTRTLVDLWPDSVTPSTSQMVALSSADRPAGSLMAASSLIFFVMQFVHFKDRSIQLVAAGSLHFIGDAGFRNGLYVIDIGQNDLADSFAKNLSYKEVVKKIPSVILEIKYAVEDIYAQGGRKFWVHNTGPLGCLPQKLSTVQKAPDDLDPYGCISSYNDAARVFNEALLLLCEELRYEKKDATIVYVDVYTIKYDLIANSTKYGFSSPLMACCGFGGPPYNYDVRVTCGHPGYQVCDEDSKNVSWDGIHYTEAANSIIASKILSTDYSTPRIAFDYFCN